MSYEPLMRLFSLAPRARDGLQRAGSQWKVRCPAHRDAVSSLAIKVGDDGRLLLTCHAGCSTKAVLDAWGVGWAALFPGEPEPNGHVAAAGAVAPARTRRPRGEPEAVYAYQAEDGSLLYEVVRFAGKDFRQRRLLPDGTYAWNLQHTRRVLYRLPELAQAAPETPVFLCEGEKDADRLRAGGLVATTAPGGAGKWHRDYSELLRGRPVVILPDNDEPGRQHVEAVAKSLEGVAASVVVLELEGLAEHGDVSDWLDAGHTADELLERRTAVPAPAVAEAGVLFASVESTPITWLWLGYLAVGKITVVVGPPGDGKTMVAIDLGARLTAAGLWPDGTFGHGEAGGLVYCSAEDDLADTLLPRFLEAGGVPERAVALATVPAAGGEREVYLPEDIAAVEAAIRRVNARLVVFDPWAGFLSGKLDGNYDQAVRQAMRPLKEMAERCHVAVLVVMHPNKNTSTTAMYRAGGSLGTVAAARIVFACGRDPENHERRVLAPIKANLTAFPPSLAFTVDSGVQAARIEWETEGCTLTADDVLKALPPGQEKRTSAVGTAKAMLSILLADQALDRELAVQQIIDALGCSERTVKRAARELGVVSKRTGFGQSALWSLPGMQSGQDPQSGQSGQRDGDGPPDPDADPTTNDDAASNEDTVGPFPKDGPTGPTGGPGPTPGDKPRGIPRCPVCGKTVTVAPGETGDGWCQECRAYVRPVWPDTEERA